VRIGALSGMGQKRTFRYEHLGVLSRPLSGLSKGEKSFSEFRGKTCFASAPAPREGCGLLTTLPCPGALLVRLPIRGLHVIEQRGLSRLWRADAVGVKPNSEAMRIGD